jgi:hypothetical protein
MTKHPLTPAQHTNLGRLIEALEEGLYQQDVGSLRTDVGHCCLGVGCDISGLGRWTKPAGDLCYTYEDASGYRAASLLLPSVMAHFGFPLSAGFVWLRDPSDTINKYGDEPPPHGADTSLSDANDRGWTFPQIAARIRKWRDEECEVITPIPSE